MNRAGVSPLGQFGLSRGARRPADTASAYSSGESDLGSLGPELLLGLPWPLRGRCTVAVPRPEIAVVVLAPGQGEAGSSGNTTGGPWPYRLLAGAAGAPAARAGMLGACEHCPVGPRGPRQPMCLPAPAAAALRRSPHPAALELRPAAALQLQPAARWC